MKESGEVGALRIAETDAAREPATNESDSQ
jgi:hypothetical protein